MKLKWAVRLLLAVIIGSACAMYAQANCGNDKDVGNGCSGGTGPQGPQGNPGANGANGTNGSNGQNGKDGKDASTQFLGANLVGDFAVRLYDGKRIQLQAFDTYIFGSTPGSDVFGNGQNMMIGGRVVLKLGSSYEEHELEKLRREIRALQRAQ